MHTGPMKPSDLAGALKTMGWRVATPEQVKRALTDFQRGWNLGDPLPALPVNGLNGPASRHAIRISLRENKAGRPDASPHFSWREFVCGCEGRYPACARIRVHRGLFRSLEKMRVVAGPLAIVNGYRCPAYNQKVGGASMSQHILGTAVDLVPKLKTQKVKDMRLFAGIGYQAASGLVRHVDRRDLGGNNTTGGTVDVPTIWRYNADGSRS